jgi:CHAD domain-containing protein
VVALVVVVAATLMTIRQIGPVATSESGQAQIVDALYRMRVGTREMRSALQGSGPVLDRAATRALTEELKLSTRHPGRSR